jgi:hypothetical protein
MDVSYSFGHIQKHTEKMVKVFNAGIHDLCKEGDAAAFVPYIREHQVSSDVDVITTTVTTSVRSSVSATVSAGLAAKFPPEELKSFRINAVMPNFDYLRAVTVDVFENEPIVSIESLYKVRVQFHTPLYLQL